MTVKSLLGVAVVKYHCHTVAAQPISTLYFTRVGCQNRCSHRCADVCTRVETAIACNGMSSPTKQRSNCRGDRKGIHQSRTTCEFTTIDFTVVYLRQYCC